MYKYIKNIFLSHRIIKIYENYIPVKGLYKTGRWNVNKTEKQIEISIHLANIDNCGTCKLN